MCIRMSKLHMYKGSHTGQKRALFPLELELLTVIMWVLGTELPSSVKVPSPLTSEPFSSCLHFWKRKLEHWKCWRSCKRGTEDHSRLPHGPQSYKTHFFWKTILERSPLKLSTKLRMHSKCLGKETVCVCVWVCVYVCMCSMTPWPKHCTKENSI